MSAARAAGDGEDEISNLDEVLAELIGDPDEGEPDGPFIELEALLAASSDTQQYALRKLIERDPTAAMRTMFPPYTKAEALARSLEYARQRRIRDVRKILDEDDATERAASQPEPPDPISLTDFLAEPDEPVRYRVNGLWPAAGRVVLAAQNKSGKTTLAGNLIRCLVDGERFLDAYDVAPVERVVLIDDELSPNMIRSWLRDQDITNTDAVTVVSLRGRLSTFNLLDPTVRSQWAGALGPSDVLIFDCLRPALDSLGLSEDKDAGRFLVALDELCREADLTELMVVHHMGHSNERSRGDSRIEDWPDAKWKLVVDDEGARYFSAFGRDVDSPEARLHFEPATRRLRVDGPGRKQAATGKIESEIVMYLAENPGCGMNEIKAAIDGDNVTKSRVAKRLVSDGRLVVRKEGQKNCHYLPEDVPNVETPPKDGYRADRAEPGCSLVSPVIRTTGLPGFYEPGPVRFGARQRDLRSGSDQPGAVSGRV